MTVASFVTMATTAEWREQRRHSWWETANKTEKRRYLAECAKEATVMAGAYAGIAFITTPPSAHSVTLAEAFSSQ